jgi:L-fuculose-phosphate aldolase
MLLPKLREEIVETGRQIYKLKLVTDLSGNISARETESGLIAIKPSGVHWLEIQPEDVVIMDEQGKIVEGDRKPSIETPMHTSIYRNYPEAGAVVHSHSPYATGFAVARKPIPPVCINSAEVGGEIPVTPYHPPGSSEMARSAVECLRSKKAALIAAHGVVCIGKNLQQAVYFNTLVELIAQLALIRQILGSDAQLSPEELAALGVS